MTDQKQVAGTDFWDDVTEGIIKNHAQEGSERKLKNYLQQYRRQNLDYKGELSSESKADLKTAGVAIGVISQLEGQLNKDVYYRLAHEIFKHGSHKNVADFKKYLQEHPESTYKNSRLLIKLLDDLIKGKFRFANTTRRIAELQIIRMTIEVIAQAQEEKIRLHPRDTKLTSRKVKGLFHLSFLKFPKEHQSGSSNSKEEEIKSLLSPRLGSSSD